MKTTIPAKTIVTCDRCNEELCDKNKNNLLGGYLRYGYKNGIDYSGVAVASGRDYEFDLCDRCYRSLDKCIDKWERS